MHKEWQYEETDDLAVSNLLKLIFILEIFIY